MTLFFVLIINKNNFPKEMQFILAECEILHLTYITKI